MSKFAFYGIVRSISIHTVGSKSFFADSKWRDTYQFLPRIVQENWLADSIDLSKQCVLENNKIGKIDPGKYANLVILNSNPLEKIKST
jgi:N-acetylglucosamine-6-phosphate deacetylase